MINEVKRAWLKRPVALSIRPSYVKHIHARVRPARFELVRF